MSIAPFREIARSSLDQLSKVRQIIFVRVHQMADDSDLLILSIKEDNELPDAVRISFRESLRLADKLVRDIIEEALLL
ncbi:hypothetical protein FNH05_08120 [Amycolatopsis rhizosphaerae]|uniref:Uncharacterized protein n=1 Tax=Amycolatopsis rhizosphaerae TaxID=2053003 RepID=A0A558D6R5_9PSEU|nr:hypothetical protein [Amycolatopsis rhizosphaerae]TVT56705.1 hypothetical protein FNH05_08120 [Amycolatopsis rhizosphaerae]